MTPSNQITSSTSSLSAFCYIFEKVWVQLSNKNLLCIKKKPECFCPSQIFLGAVWLQGFSSFWGPMPYLLSFSFVRYWQGYVILALESHLVSLNQKFNSQFPFSPKGKDYLTLRLWLESVIECHVDGFKVPFSHWRAEDISAKLLSASHTWIFILLDA